MRSTAYDDVDYAASIGDDGKTERERQAELLREEQAIDDLVDSKIRERRRSVQPTPLESLVPDGEAVTNELEVTPQDYHISALGAMNIASARETVASIVQGLRELSLEEWPKLLVDLVDVREQLRGVEETIR